MPIVRRAGKMTKQEVIDLGTDPIINLMYSYAQNSGVVSALKKLLPGQPMDPARKFEQLFGMIMPGWLGASKITSGEGAPNAKFQEYEGYPGAWVYGDTETGITFVVWSDGWKKHPWKGSSIEWAPPQGSMFNDVSDTLPFALERMVKHLAKSSSYYGMLKPDAFEKWVNE